MRKILIGDVIKKGYKYIKLNGTKYYWDEYNETNKNIFYILGGNKIKQADELGNNGAYVEYVNKIKANTSGISYYKEAYDFTKRVLEKLGSLTPGHAQAGEQVKNSGRGANQPIFANKQIEYPNSNFNLHRKEVIRYSIESNLSVAIANFNSYTNVDEANFQMPKLKETEWELLENEVSIISFLQGLNMGGKIYNGYTVVTNDKTEEVVKEERIYITTNDNYYHKVNDKHLIDEDAEISAGVLDLDFEIRKDVATGVYYIHREQLGCYTSIVGQETVNNKYDSIYEYLQELDSSDKTSVNYKLKQAYYTALGRERWGTYKIENPSDIVTILGNMNPPDDETGETPEPGETTEPPIITIESSILPSQYIADLEKPTINAKVEITSENVINKAEYIFTTSSIAPAEGWSDITISADRKSAYISDISQEVLEAGTWYLHVKAIYRRRRRNGRNY